MADFRTIVCVLFVVLTSCGTCYSLDFTRFKLRLPSIRLNLLSENREVCYGVLGCFSLEGDFSSRPLNVLPAGPTAINTRFYLYTRDNATGNGVTLGSGHADALLESGFNATRPTKLIIHGLLDNGRTPWLNRMREALLEHGDYNVMQVDWGDGSLLPYTQATANTRVAGAEIARFLTFLQSHTEARMEEFHLIGHSLGAHVAGYAGERLDNLGRITALDPAGPYFEGMPSSVKVDETDALYVDVIHTDASNFMHALIDDSGKQKYDGLGMEEETGHIDFYPNDGREQPGCEPIRSISTGFMRNVFQDTMAALYGGGRNLIACSHHRAIEVMTESMVTTCPFRSYPCIDYATFLAGRCLECTDDMPCADLGIHSSLPSSNQTTSRRHHLYLQTGSRIPTCRHHYGVSVTLGEVNTTDTHPGWIHVIYMGTRANVTVRISAAPDSTESFDLTSSESYTVLSTYPRDVGEIEGVQVWWKCDSPWWDLITCWRPSTVVNIRSLQIFHGETQTRYTFADDDDHVVNPGEVVWLN